MLWLALLWSASAEPPPAERSELANGIDVVIHSDTALQRTLAAVVVDIGLGDDPFEASGRAAVVARLLYAGRERVAPWRYDLAEIGAVGTFYLETERTTFLREAPSAPGVLDHLVFALADGLAHPPVADTPLHAGIVFGSGWWSGPYATGKRQILDLLGAEGGGSEPRSPVAHAAPLVAESIARWTDPARLTVYVVGPERADDAAAVVTRLFSGLRPRAVDVGPWAAAVALRAAPVHAPVRAEMAVPVEDWVPTAPPVRHADIPFWGRAWRLPGAAPVELQVAVEVLARRVEPLGLRTRWELGETDGWVLLTGGGEASVGPVDAVLRALAAAGPAPSELEAALAGWRLAAVVARETPAGRFSRLRACVPRGANCPDDALEAAPSVTPEQVAAAVRAWLRSDRGRWFAPGGAAAAPEVDRFAPFAPLAGCAPGTNCGLAEVPPEKQGRTSVAEGPFALRAPPHTKVALANGRILTVAPRPDSGLVVLGLRFSSRGTPVSQGGLSADALAALDLAWGAASDPVGADIEADCDRVSCTVKLTTTPDRLGDALGALYTRLTVPVVDAGALARAWTRARSAWDAGFTGEPALFRVVSPQVWLALRAPEVPSQRAISEAARRVLSTFDARLVAVGQLDLPVLTAHLERLLPSITASGERQGPGATNEVGGAHRIHITLASDAPTVAVTWSTPTDDPLLQRLLWRIAQARLEARLRDADGRTGAIDTTFDPARVVFSVDLPAATDTGALRALDVELARLAEEGIPEAELSATLHGALGRELDWAGGSTDLAAILLDGAPDPAALVGRARSLTAAELSTALRAWLARPKTWIYSATAPLLDALAADLPPDIRWSECEAQRPGCPR